MLKRITFVLSVSVLCLAVTLASNGIGIRDALADYHRWKCANVDKSHIESAHPVMKDVHFNRTA